MKKLENAAERYAELYDLAPTGYVSFTRSGQIAEINLSGEQLIGLPRERLIGMPFALFVCREDNSLFLSHLVRCRRLCARVETELRLKNAARKLIPVRLFTIPTTASSHDGSLLFQTSIFDLTERIQFEEKLRSSERRYRTLFDLVPVAIYTCDTDGTIKEYNQRAVELWGAEPGLNGNEPKFCGSHKIYYPDGRPMPHEKCPMARALRGEKLTPKDLEIIVEQPNGERRHVVPAPQILRDSSGKITGAINCLYDVTESERAREQLQRTMEFDEAVLTNMGEGLYTVDAEGLVTTMNPAAERLFGWRLEEIRGKKMHDVTHYKHRDGSPFPAHECPALQALRNGKPRTHCEDVFIRKGGTFFDVIYTVSPIRKGGKTGGLVVVFRDITDQKRIEAAGMRLAALVRSSHDAVVAKDLNGIITDWNQSAQRIFGYKPKEIIGKSILTLIPKDRRSEETEILRRIGKSESLEHYETIRRCKDGRLIEVSLTISPIKDLKGKVIGASKIARDITERRAIERQLVEQARLLDLSSDAILVRDGSDRILYWNRGATELYGYSNAEAEGKISHDLLRTDHPEPLKNICGKLRRDNRWSGELVHTRKDGTKITVSSRWALDCDAGGKPIAVLETNTDITARKRAELELQRSKDALERMVEQRTKELIVTNSELRNEIERRKGLEGEILTVSDREQQRLGQELHDGLCQHLTAVAFMTRSIALRLKNHRVIEVGDIEKIAQLVNDAATDTRNLSRALHRVDVDAAGLIDALQDLVDREIWRTPCRLEVKPSFRIDDDAAAVHIYRIAREAVINANKHAHAREIVIRLERLRREMALHVMDDGIGLSDEPKLKQGLGLHIMQYRSQLAGGRLEIDSRKGGGTRVSCFFQDGLLQSLKSGKQNGEPPKFSRPRRGNPPRAV